MGLKLIEVFISFESRSDVVRALLRLLIVLLRGVVLIEVLLDGGMTVGDKGDVGDVGDDGGSD